MDGILFIFTYFCNIGYTYGSFLTTIFAIAELDRNTIIERTQAGKEIAKKNPNFKDERPRKYTNEQIRSVIEMVAKLGYNKSSKITGISKSTLIRYRKENQNE